MCFAHAGVNFQYRDPERGFDRGKVKGVVAKLVHLQDPTTTTALEVAAGGKLYQVWFCTAMLTFCVAVASSVAGLCEAEINPVIKCITS